MRKMIIRNSFCNFSKMRIVLAISLSIVLMLSNNLFANAGQSVGQQKKTVTGKVVSAVDNEPIIGATVSVEGTTSGTVTNIDGDFSIEANASDVLLFSFIGFKQQKVTVGNQTTLSVFLEQDVTDLDEVVVVGYGTVKKSDISGSVASVDKEAMMKRNPVNIAQGLQGAAAGVRVSTRSGSPDGASTVSIRGTATINGSTEPLYVVDGVQMGTDISFINPSDIESIEILKDASATAIYGAKGANGVIMVTTKHGTTGATQLSVSASFGIQHNFNYFDVGDADDFAYVARTARANDGNVLSMSIWGESYDGKRKTIDWQKEMTRNSLVQQYNLSLSGGTEKHQSHFSVGYLDNDGVVINSNYTRLTARANSIYKVADFIEVGGDVSFVHSEKYGTLTNNGNDGNLTSLRDMAMLVPSMDYIDDASGELVSPNVENEDGTYGVFKQLSATSEISRGQDNPYAMQKTIDEKTRENRVLASGYIDVKLLKGLNFKSVASYNYYSRDYYNYECVKERYNNGEQVDIANYSAIDNFTLSPAQSNELSIESYFTYQWKNDIHNVSAMVGNSVSKTFGSWTSVYSEDFPASTIRDISLTQDNDSKTASGSFDLETRFISYFGRVTYSLLDRYIFTGTLRKDGSSNFGEGNRWGTFPSAALAWRITEEPFMQNNDIFDNLKLRLGWGCTGNAGPATNLNAVTLSTDRIAAYFFQQGGAASSYSTTTGYASTNIVDENLKWEKNEQFNIGLDMGFCNNSLTFTFDYYIRNTKDLLVYRSLRPSSGFSQMYTNDGEVKNSGFEFSVNYSKQFGDWNLGATLTGATLKSEITKLSSDIFFNNDYVNSGIHWDDHAIAREGYAVGSYYGYKVDGIFTDQADVDKYDAIAVTKNGEGSTYQEDASPGDYRYKDLNDDGQIDSDDCTVIGDGYPDLNYGINLTANYKNFDFSVYMYGVVGQDILSYSALKLENIYPSDDGLANLLKGTAAKSWTESNTDAALPRLTIADDNYNCRISDAYVKNGDFFKLQNIQVGYTFDSNLLKSIRMQSARIYVSVDNVLTISKYKKYGDPEVGSGITDDVNNPSNSGETTGNATAVFKGLDTGRYPLPTTFTFGVSMKF